MTAVKQVKIWICEACLSGEGSECHTPGCALYLHRIDIPISQYESMRAVSADCLSALRGYKQADRDGVMVTVSRQALEEAILALSN